MDDPTLSSPIRSIFVCGSKIVDGLGNLSVRKVSSNGRLNRLRDPHSLRNRVQVLVLLSFSLVELQSSKSDDDLL